MKEGVQPSYMDENADDRIPIRTSTKELLKERMDVDETYDYWIRKQLGATNDGR